MEERSAKDIPTTNKDIAPLLEDINDPQRKARKTLDQLIKRKLLTSNLKVRNKKYKMVFD